MFVAMTFLFSSLVSVSAQNTSSQQELVNAGVVGVLGGRPGGTYIKLVHDLAVLLDDDYDMRVLPMTGKGSVRSVEDLIYLRGIDIALVQSDILDFYKTSKLIPDIDQKIRYITKLYDEEIHLLSRFRFQSIQDLKGARVNFGPASSGTHLTAQLIFTQLGIITDILTYDQDIALEKLLQGEIDAMVRVVGKPWDLAADLPIDAPVHLLSIPIDRVQGAYSSTNLTSADYPNLIEPGSTIKTAAVGAVMAVYNWPAGHLRRRVVEEFVGRLDANFGKLLESPFHSKWHQVDRNLDIPGWERF